MYFDISKDRKYLQLENTIVDLETGIKINIDSAHPAFICEMFKNQFTHSYKHKLMENNELFHKMKQLIYPLISHDKGIVSEYEVRYGMNLIFESSETFSLTTYKTIEESWEFVKTKMLEMLPITPNELIEGFWSDAWEKTKQVAGAVWDKVKEGAQWIVSKGLPWFFEKLESFLLSPVGIGIDVALTAIGIGKIATTLLWGALGAWKIYQLMTGKIPNDAWSYLDIAICFVGLIFTGGAAKGLKATVKAAGRDMSKLGKGALKPILDLISKGGSFLSNALLKPLEWLASIFGSKAQSIISTVKSSINKFFEKLSSLIKPSSGGKSLTAKVIKKGVKTDLVNPVKQVIKGQGPVSVGKALRKGTTAGLALHGAMKGIEGGAKMYGEKKANKEKETLIKIASDEKVLQQTTSASLNDALSQMKALDNQ